MFLIQVVGFAEYTQYDKPCWESSQNHKNIIIGQSDFPINQEPRLISFMVIKESINSALLYLFSYCFQFQNGDKDSNPAEDASVPATWREKR